jgi:DNA-binding IscR family transcriptional regulator
MFLQPASVTLAIDIVLFVAWATANGTKATVKVMAEALAPSEGFKRADFVSKVNGRLAHAGIVHTAKGIGTTLLRAPDTITVREIVLVCGGLVSPLPDYFGRENATYARLTERVLDTKVSTLLRRVDFEEDTNDDGNA